MENYLPRVVGLVALITAFLLILSSVSREVNFAGISFRKMDILSDVRPNRPLDMLNQQEDTLTIQPSDTSAWAIGDTTQAIVQHDTLPPADPSIYGRSIEDYTSEQEGLGRLFRAVDSIRLSGKKVRIAFFGDSFVEGDIMLGDLRDTLQSVWGGAGVGFVPMTSEVARFRRTYLQQHIIGWRSYSILKPEGRPYPLGINGYLYMPNPDASVRFDGTKQYGFSHTRAWGDLRLFYRASEGVNFVWQQDGYGPTDQLLTATKGPVGLWEYSAGAAKIPAVAFRFPQTNGLGVYGASLEAGPGVYIDNFSVRGNSGGKLKYLEPAVMQAFDKIQQYDLIVLQFGLNAAGPVANNIKWYRAELDRTVAHIQQCFPGKPILFISLPDRGGKVNGELGTLPSVPAIAAMQRSLARDHGLLFLDFFHFLGGEGSMVRLAQTQHPRLANTDYTHLTHEGGRVVGLQLAQLILEAYRGRRVN